MKLLSLLACSVLLLPVVKARADAKSDKILQQLAGKWDATFKGEPVTFEIGVDGTFTLGVRGDAMKGSFTIDCSAEPWKMDLDAKGKNARKGYTIFRIKADGTMDWAEPRDEEESRPTEFNKSFAFTKSASGPAKGEDENSIVGHWETDDDTLSMTFSADGKFNFEEGDGLQRGTYKLDKSVLPHVVEVTMEKNKTTSYLLFRVTDEILKVSDPAATKEKLGKVFVEGKNSVLHRAKGPGEGEGPDPKLVGKWKGNATDEKIELEFKADGTFDLSRNGGAPVIGTYITHPEKKPAMIDLMARNQSMLAIYRIEGERLTMTEPDRKRAENFDGKKVLIAEKVK